ncbi:hypothetical protein Pcinc_044230 [Petrolisthes cinctipes]|uniref:Uncharacterized protein n=1 Tax=Petrolisthes cinctipes TaxID=88211 RepID=A0AAE1EFK6_PETCI|nr:hypothetical protein Pcinc_044230 [Petrolisthes cinctipes]
MKCCGVWEQRVECGGGVWLDRWSVVGTSWELRVKCQILVAECRRIHIALLYASLTLTHSASDPPPCLILRLTHPASSYASLTLPHPTPHSPCLILRLTHPDSFCV